MILKQIPEVEWDTQETQPLELTHGLCHICCQIPPLSPSLIFGQQCYQWFTRKWIVLWLLTYLVLLVKALRLLIQMRNSRWVTDVCPKKKNKVQWKLQSLKNKIMISFCGFSDRKCVIVNQSSPKVVWNGTQHIQKKILVQWGFR